VVAVDRTERGLRELEEMLAIGSVITAMPVVNAIPAVIAARPGVVTYVDLPTQASRHVPHGS